jgi:hypothetical protein
MSEGILSANTVKLLQEIAPNQPDLDAKVRLLLEGEYLRRLARYHEADRVLSQKYGMSFQDFAERDVVKQKEYAWETEKDEMDWEVAVSGIETFTLKLRRLRESNSVHLG